MAELRIELLGPIRAWRGTSELPLGPARQRAVLATLALRAGHTVSREQLICAVWGSDEAPASASGNVHTYISGLRRILDRSILTGGRGGYTLRVPPGSVDSIAFEHLVNLGSPDEALALWHGEPLSGMRGAFADQRRARLAELRLKAVELRAERLLARGEHRELATELTALTREHPLRERLRELLMLALDHGGRHAEALAVFRDTRTTLIAELGVEPGPALRRLHQRLLTGVRDPAPDLHRVTPVRADPVFVGRTAELSRLRTMIDGGSGSAWLEGDFGIGKSTLLAKALSGIGRRHLGWAHATELPMPSPALASCLGTSDDPAARVSRLCATAPLILVLDDMQWADDATIRSWHRLLDATRRLPLLLVASARPLPRSRQLARLRQSVDTVISLGPLSTTESHQLQETLLGVPASPDVRALACGNPRYLTELTRGLVAENALDVASGTAELARPFTPPRSLLEALSRKLVSLSGDAREILRWAALLDRRFTVAEISALTGKRPSDLLAAFEETLTACVLADHGAYLAFAHPLLRKACYAAIPPAFRQALRDQARERSLGVPDQ
ncbi:BTAD domain-containing putative transcriptional regulator [Amycolatopsis sp. NPDC059657]|uniref:BTAD domain-containing putative transcriptional regulator n=1 Tax=Amycolatopsis sp. NPDC059657 TaxID=3346899 RepID=UPI00366A9A09